jgi:hypothetical protein
LDDWRASRLVTVQMASMMLAGESVGPALLSVGR